MGMADEEDFLEEYLKLLYTNELELKQPKEKKTRVKIKRAYGFKMFLYFIVGVLFFMLFFFPMYLTQYTSLIGDFFKVMLKEIGTYTMYGGFILVAIGVFSAIVRKKFKFLALGIILVIIGLLLTGGSINFLGIEFDPFEGNRGYH
jgi:hypothetical protein